MIEIIGTIVFAISGALLACRKGYDLSAVLVIAFIVGNGGGTIRDVVIGATPVFWIEQPVYVIVSLLTGLLVFLIATRVDVTHQALLIADALGLGVFAVAGAEKTLHLGLPLIVAIMMGVVTAAGGGLLRDILCRDEPVIFQPEVYATAVFAGSALFVPLYLYGPSRELAAWICVCLIFGIRLATMRWGWRIPTFQSRKRWWR